MASNLFVNKLSNKCMGGLFGRKKGKQRKKKDIGNKYVNLILYFD